MNATEFCNKISIQDGNTPSFNEQILIGLLSIYKMREDKLRVLLSYSLENELPKRCIEQVLKETEQEPNIFGER
mgnify:CR=1 FL=1|jgi:hypothetical protein|tara:strand:- start:1281 stop:1502 length:222 start_codon:yes stop_codon:yes gene_type:complete